MNQVVFLRENFSNIIIRIKNFYIPMDKKNISLLTIIFSFFLFLEVHGQRVYPPEIDNAEKITYKTIEGVQLNVWIFKPEKHQSTDSAPAIVFFFGGGWNSGSPSQFVKHCEYLASRGMVAMVADYRVKSRNKVSVKECVTDAKSVIRWVRENASQLGIDRNRIAAGGGSAGGHLAAACALLPKFDDEKENTSISSKPNALVLFNPVLVLTSRDEFSKEASEKAVGFDNRFGAKLEDLSPYDNIAGQMPPTIIFHGTDDKTVSFANITKFVDKMHTYGNSCTLVAYEGEPHGFFNYGLKSNALFVDTVHKMDEFFVSLGYLKGPSKSEVYRNSK